MEEIIELTKSLIRFQSVQSQPEEINRCAQFIELFLSEAGIKYQRFDHQNTPSILVFPASRKARILLMSHFDVVEGDDQLFQPHTENGYLFGRGSLDDKYAVAISLVLIKEFISRYKNMGLSQEDLPFGILMTGDEEVGGTNGANKVLASIKPEFCIALDGGNVNEIVTKEKGIAQLRLVSNGKTSHGSRPWLGQNAIDSLISDYQEICKLFDLTKPDNWHRTINLAKIEAGHSFNQVPGYAEAILDIRFTENDPIEQLIETMRQSINGELVVHRLEPLFTANPSPYLDRLLDHNPEISTASEHGSSDARFLSMHGINGVVWGANGNLSHHSDQEHVDIQSIISLYQKLSHFIESSSEPN